MNRIATLTDPKADQFTGKIDSEWVMGHHLMVNEIAVRGSATRLCRTASQCAFAVQPPPAPSRGGGGGNLFS